MAKADPENKLLWNQNRRRMAAEALRDSSPMASGPLTKQAAGPPLNMPLDTYVAAPHSPHADLDGSRRGDETASL